MSSSIIASPQTSEYLLPAQSPHSDYKILSDALASPNQVISSASRATPSSREWYSKGLLGGADGDLPFFNIMSPSSGTRGATKRRKVMGSSSSSSSSRGSGDEMGIGLFGDGAEKGLRDGDFFSPKLLHSPSGMSSLLSPPEGYRGAGTTRGNVGIAFKGVDFDNFDAIQTVSTSSDRSRDSLSTSSPLSPSLRKRSGGDTDGGNEGKLTGRGHRKRKASRKGGEAPDVSPISDQNLDGEDSREGGFISNLINSNIGRSHQNINSKRKSRVSSGSRKSDNSAHHASLGEINLHTSPVHLNSAPRSVTPLAEGKSHIKCNCKKSKCLKLYCDCFRVSKYCEDCNCLDCNNCVERETERTAAINSILERNPDAFAPRIKHDAESMTKGHLSGCHCKKSACLKKYCECFSAAVACTEKCRCMDCRNTNEHVAPVSKSISVSPPMQEQYALHAENESTLLDDVDEPLLELKFDVGVR